jgi:hypothetical protein
VGEDAIEFADRFKFEGFFGGELVGFFAIEEGFHAGLEVVAEFEEAGLADGFEADAAEEGEGAGDGEGHGGSGPDGGLVLALSELYGPVLGFGLVWEQMQVVEEIAMGHEFGPGGGGVLSFVLSLRGSAGIVLYDECVKRKLWVRRSRRGFGSGCVLFHGGIDGLLLQRFPVLMPWESDGACLGAGRSRPLGLETIDRRRLDFAHETIDTLLRSGPLRCGLA